MTGRLVDMSFSLNRKQRITLEVDSDFRSLWDKLNQEPLLDIEIKKHRNKRSHSANAYFHVLVNKIAAETGESDDLVKERLVVAYGTVARDKDGCTVGFKLPVSVDVHDLYKYTRCFDVREEDGKWFNCYEEGRLTSWTNAEPNAILSAVTGGATSRTIAGRSLTTK